MYVRELRDLGKYCIMWCFMWRTTFNQHNMWQFSAGLQLVLMTKHLFDGRQVHEMLQRLDITSFVSRPELVLYVCGTIFKCVWFFALHLPDILLWLERLSVCACPVCLVFEMNDTCRPAPTGSSNLCCCLSHCYHQHPFLSLSILFICLLFFTFSILNCPFSSWLMPTPDVALLIVYNW